MPGKPLQRNSARISAANSGVQSPHGSAARLVLACQFSRSQRARSSWVMQRTSTP